MSLYSKKILMLLLASMLVHVPIPWWHKHAGLDDVALAVHAASYHRGRHAPEMPHGWHWHLLQDDVAFGPLANREPSQNKSEAWSARNWWLGSDLNALAAVFNLIANRAGARNGLPYNGLKQSMMASGQDIYLHLCVLRL